MHTGLVNNNSRCGVSAGAEAAVAAEHSWYNMLHILNNQQVIAIY